MSCDHLEKDRSDGNRSRWFRVNWPGEDIWTASVRVPRQNAVQWWLLESVAKRGPNYFYL